MSGLRTTLAATAALVAGVALASAPTHNDPICRYRSGGALPDPVCTPGAVNPAVTQATIKRTICKAGWTKTVRPKSLEREKRLSMREYGAGGEPGEYEYDHLISLQLGGAPADPRNLWPEPYKTGIYGDARDKDSIENNLKRWVCAGALDLRAAQKLISGDWRSGVGLPVIFDSAEPDAAGVVWGFSR